MKKTTTKILLPLLLLLLLAAPLLLSFAPYYLYHLTLLLLFITLAYSWGLLYYAGTLSLGHAGFFGLGAYASALLVVKGGLSPWVGLLWGGLIAGGVSLLPALLGRKLRGAYFALATLAFAEILKALMQNLTALTNGPWGLLGIPALALPFDILPEYLDHRQLAPYYGALIISGLTFFLVHRLYGSRWGLYLACLRENPLGALAVGINPWLGQSLALFLSAFLAGAAGALYAHTVRYIYPETVFNLHFSAAPLIMCLLGGGLTLWGPLIGALGLYTLSEIFLTPLFPHLHDAFYGLAVVVVFLFMPKGIVERFKKGKVKRHK